MIKKRWPIYFLIIFIIAMMVYGVLLKISRPQKLVSGAEITKLTLPPFNKPPQSNTVSKPKVYAKASLLVDQDTFKILSAQNETEKVPIASTTKIMTAMVVLEDYKDRIKEVATITPAMTNVEGSRIQLRTGEKITIENLLRGMLIYSGNDAAYALAITLGGTKEQFVQKMNDKAAFLGLKNSQYKDPAGLDDNGYSTAYDLAILASLAMHHEQFAAIVKTANADISSVDGRIIHKLENSNRMIKVKEPFYYSLAIGIKTGFTYAAGHCLVGAAKKDNHTLIAVVLNTNANTVTASAEESRKLLDWGFSNWTW